MEFEFTNETRLPRHETFAWMTDFTGDDHRGRRWGRGAARKILSRTERLIELEDEWRGRTLYVTVHLDPPNAWHIRGRTRGARYETTHALEDLPSGGCSILTKYKIEGHGIVKLLLPLFARNLRKTIVEDMRLHVEDMEEQLG
ncbi:MAG: hypothetical protein HY557_06450, partial [Euryarchaeota archaeon]|nr:hypothetical protein [Euryarchaeota archaeon]